MKLITMCSFLSFSFNAAAILRDLPRTVVTLELLGGSQMSFCIKDLELNIQHPEVTQHPRQEVDFTALFYAFNANANKIYCWSMQSVRELTTDEADLHTLN